MEELPEDFGENNKMAVKIRMARFGRLKRPFYRIVVADSQFKRDGRHIEIVGNVDPMQDPPAYKLNEERIKYWIQGGAKPSETVGSIIDKEFSGYWSNVVSERRKKIQAKRARRKQRHVLA